MKTTFQNKIHISQKKIYTFLLLNHENKEDAYEPF